MGIAPSLRASQDRCASPSSVPASSAYPARCICNATATRHADRSRAPGTATSFGNAGGIVTGAVVPNSTPALWHDIPHMLFDRDSAVRVRWRYLPRIAPWLLRFLLAGRDARVHAIADALLPLVTRAYDAHRELIALSGADDLVRPVGWLKVYETEAAFARTRYDRDIMAARGIRCDVLDPTRSASSSRAWRAAM